MPVYYVNTYDITDPVEFSKYPPLVRIVLQKYGAEVLALDLQAVAVEGKAHQMNAVIRFPSMEAALACYDDPEYQPAKKIRQSSTANCTMVLVREWVAPGG